MDYALINRNNLYEDLHDLLEENDFNMHDINKSENIKYCIKKYIHTLDYVNFIKACSKDRMNDIVSKLDELSTLETLEINTILLYSNEKYAYEAIYLKNEIENNNNQFATISNTELLCINGYVAIIKTKFLNGEYIEDNMTFDDLAEIIIKNFYHIGLMINPNNSINELEFNTDKPFRTIGNTFKQIGTIELLNVSFVLYNEESDESNELVMKLFNNYSNIKGRCFISVLSPEPHLKFLDLTKNMFEKILYLIETKTVLTDEDNRVHNPFYYFS